MVSSSPLEQIAKSAEPAKLGGRTRVLPVFTCTIVAFFARLGSTALKASALRVEEKKGESRSVSRPGMAFKGDGCRRSPPF